MCVYTFIEQTVNKIRLNSYPRLLQQQERSYSTTIEHGSGADPLPMFYILLVE